MGRTGITVFYHRIEAETWLGGANYFRNLEEVTARFLTDVELRGISYTDVKVFYPAFRDKFRVAMNRLLRRKEEPSFVSRGRRQYLESLSPGREICAFVLFSGHFPMLADLPVIFWVPDFQVFHLPGYFKPEDIERRKKNYAAGAAKADIILLSSDAARKDLNRFYPGHESKVKVLRFVVDIPGAVYEKDPRFLLEKYHLPEKFIYVPNQFWVHKNHALIIEALAVLKRRNHELHVVLSGSTLDPRNPGHYDSLLGLVKANGLEKNISVLGIIEKEDVAQLIRQSCFVINASRFEGWSTTVEEVKSIGKKILLSSLDVHREQDPPGASYFDPDNAGELAELMLSAWNSSAAGPDAEMEKHARETLPLRLKGFAETFGDIVHSLMDADSRRKKEQEK
ncbi:MAG TPA: glycosyltransferase family 1 protein [Bacteroidia bacterium]|nr:glycosyltransferase family 1 protein [Bacteroidia bacterium]